MKISFDVKKNSIYLELTITADTFGSWNVSHDNVCINSGLLDEKESVEIAKELIYAAERLLPASCGESELKLAEIRQDELV